MPSSAARATTRRHGSCASRERVGEEVGQHQVAQPGLVVVGLADAVQEARADDAAATPDRRHRAEVDLPPLLVRGGRHLGEPLRVGDDLRRVQRVLEVVGELFVAGAGRVGVRPSQHGRRRGRARP